MRTRDLHRIRRWARGSVRSADASSLSPARLEWVDPETGERLVVDLMGSEAFLSDLEASGFERPLGGNRRGAGPSAGGPGLERPRARLDAPTPSGEPGVGSRRTRSSA